MHSRMSKRTRFFSPAMVLVNGHSFDASTVDISLTGLFISTSQHLPVGHKASISLKVPSVSRGSLVTLDGFVVRNSVHGVGLKFKALDHETFSFLKMVISNRKPLLYH